MKITGQIEIALVGGPMDGDSIVMGANGSVGPPHQLCYFGATCEQAAWMVYEAENLLETKWGGADARMRYCFIGWYSLGKGEKLRAV